MWSSPGSSTGEASTGYPVRVDGGIVARIPDPGNPVHDLVVYPGASRRNRVEESGEERES
ncbi:MAG TPA: hypothetical protein EYO84_04505 [Planctomycetes bacterium]|nr:hypothetical protein [Planctomycetota bacterium]